MKDSARFLTYVACLGLLIVAAHAGAESPPPIADEIRAEAVRPNDDPAGRQLPFAANWNCRNWTPQKQLQWIKQGHHLLPWFRHPKTRQHSDKAVESWVEENGDVLRKWAEWRMPFTMRDNNWARGLTGEKYRDLPREKNPLTVRPDGSVMKRPSPFGPLEPWREVGRGLTDSLLLRRIAEVYPDPPLIMFLSNNETRKLRWHEMENSARFLEEYGKETSDVFKRRKVAQGWKKRFSALLDSMREGLPSEIWRQKSFFVGYNAFGPCHYARWGGWKAYSLCTPERIAPQPLYWDGGSPSFYDNDWEPQKADYRVWSPQVAAMNWVFMLDEAHRLNPDFWFEMSVWDGDQRWPGDVGPKDSKPLQYMKKGQEWTPERYMGRVQYGMWLVRPRVVREFRGHVQPLDKYRPRWEAIMKSVDNVWEHKTLRRFWRKGRLVPNTDSEHPWQANTLEHYKDEHRWFRLDTGLDPEEPWDNTTNLHVFALARVLGEKPEREWLLYAHSPLGEKKDVEVEIPDYGKVTIDIEVEGSFYRVNEKEGSVKEVAL